ncbi:MAG TPA: condensation domain-containing protein, partial [Thermoanaerobaculia bacterium]|nr:condensation domain-containing protein [Thermoanaerobaculia bacterium]
MDPIKSAAAALDEKKRRLLALLMKEKGIDPLRAPILAMPRDGRAFPSSFAQERLWIVDRLDPGNTAYNLQSVLRVLGPLRTEVMAEAFTEVVRRHETLRTTFAVGVGGRPVQVIHPPAPFPLPLVDLSGLPADLRPAEARRLAVAAGGRPFDLARGPVLRALVLRLEAAEHVLLFTVHHIASDGWSNGVLIGEVASLYDAFAHGRPSPLPELPVQYADWAAWQRQVLEGEILERELAWWRERLAGSDVLELPTDRPRPAVLGPGGSMEALEVPAEVATGLKELGRAGGATLFMVTLAAFQALLARWSGQTDFNVGTPVAGRDRTEVEGLIGFFVNTLVIRADLSGDLTFRELLVRTRTVALGSLAHQQVPFEKLVEELSPERSLSHTPLFQVLFALQNAPGSTRTISGLTFLPFEATPETASFELTLSLMDVGGRLAGTLEYKTDLFERTTILRLLSGLRELLAGAAARPDTCLSELPLLTAAERTQLLDEWGRGSEVPRATQLLHAAIQARAAERPEAVAVRQGDE